MPLDPDFVADCPYDPSGFLIEDVCSVDQQTGKVVCSMMVHESLPLTRSQRVHPLKHPRHLSGGLMVHLTGMVGYVHAYYVLGLRHAHGWIGYGAKINAARFHGLAAPGTQLILEGWPTMVRRGKKRILGRYGFAFRQGETLVYEGDQTAMWLQVDDVNPVGWSGPEGVLGNS